MSSGLSETGSHGGVPRLQVGAPDGGPSRELSVKKSFQQRGEANPRGPQRTLPGTPHFLSSLLNLQTLVPAAPLPRLEGSQDGSSEPAGTQPGHGSRLRADSPDATSGPGSAPAWGPSLSPGVPVGREAGTARLPAKCCVCTSSSDPRLLGARPAEAPQRPSLEGWEPLLGRNKNRNSKLPLAPNEKCCLVSQAAYPPSMLTGGLARGAPHKTARLAFA